MSTATMHVLFCDRVLSGGAGDCDNAYDGYPGQSLREVREAALADGWRARRTTTVGTLDLCPSHAEEPTG